MDRKRQLQDAVMMIARKRARSYDERMLMGGNALASKAEPVSEVHILPPLLRLPAEIRNEIYSLVLGTNSLHVYARKSADQDIAKVDYYTCRADHDPSSIAKSSTNPEWLDQHLPCFTAGSNHLPNLALLSTCRQIYQETRLLPFSTNTFTFVAPSSMQTFVENMLRPDQAKALRSLSLWTAISPSSAPVTAEYVDTTVSWRSWVPSSRIVEERLLEGIQEINLSVSVFANDGGDADWRDMKEINGIFNFMGLARLRRVRVVVGQDEEGGLGDGKDVKFYAEEVRDRMLGRFVEIDIVEEEE